MTIRSALAVLAGSAAALVCAASAPASAPDRWTAPFDVSTTAGSPPVIASSDAGDVVVAWTRFEGPKSVVQAAIRHPDGSFSAPVDVSDPSQNATSPAVAVDDDGDAIVVWSGSDGTNTIQASTRADGGTFSSAVNVSAPGADAFGPQVAMDADGDTVVTWVRSNGSHTIAQAATRAAASTTFSSAIDLSAPGADANRALVAMNAAGDAVVLWTRALSVQAASRSAGGAFEGAVDVTPSTESGHGSAIAVADDGSAVAVWLRPRFVDGRAQLTPRAASRAGTGEFGSPVDLTSDPSVAGGQLRLAMNGAGRAIAVWEQFTTTTSASILRVAERPPGGTFATAEDLDADCWTPDVAVDDAGGATIVCRRAEGANMTTAAFTRAAPGAFSARHTITAQNEEGFDARVAVAGDGTTVAAYQAERIRVAVNDVTPAQLTSVSVPATAEAGVPVTMRAFVSDDWGPVTVSFAFGDGQSATGESVSHTYATRGTFTVTVTATDGGGSTSTAMRTITVAPPNGAGSPLDQQPSTGQKDAAATFAASVAGSGPSLGPRANEAVDDPTPPASVPALSLRAAELLPKTGAARIGRFLARGLSLRFTAPAPGRLEVRWFVSDGRARAARTVVVARGAVMAAGAGKVNVKVRPTVAGRRLLRRSRRVRVSARAAFTPTGGTTISVSRRFSLKR